ncbi:MAG: outer membrane protein assembly factor BamE, partial [Gammaproteobacteria bacterium]|nr:outer membrane protein assembly factor BamE [Gammaproteobacteria bacterium]
FVLVLLLYGTTGFSQTKIDVTELAKQYPAKTALSKKALHLKTGMTKKQVINLLGPPTWAKNETGISLVWLWNNGRCNPVYVTFNKRMRVNGFDEGREECLEEKYDALPEDQFLCSNKNNQALCHL